MHRAEQSKGEQGEYRRRPCTHYCFSDGNHTAADAPSLNLHSDTSPPLTTSASGGAPSSGRCGTRHRVLQCSTRRTRRATTRTLLTATATATATTATAHAHTHRPKNRQRRDRPAEQPAALDALLRHRLLPPPGPRPPHVCRGLSPPSGAAVAECCGLGLRRRLDLTYCDAMVYRRRPPWLHSQRPSSSSPDGRCASPGAYEYLPCGGVAWVAPSAQGATALVVRSPGRLVL